MSQPAKITIKNIAIDCILGAFKPERQQKQTIFVSLELFVDAEKASQTDNLEDTMNYFSLYERIIAFVSSSQFYLLEALVSGILTLCLEEEKITEAIVQVEKPTVLPKAKGVIVEMRRKK